MICIWNLSNNVLFMRERRIRRKKKAVPHCQRLPVGIHFELQEPSPGLPAPFDLAGLHLPRGSDYSLGARLLCKVHRDGTTFLCGPYCLAF